MLYIIYFLLGFICVSLGALPLGTVNVAVINTTLKDSFNEAKKIMIPASIAEVLLTALAIYYFTFINSFFESYPWLQLVIVGLLIVLGCILIFGKKNCIKDEYGECIVTKNKRFVLPKSILGFLLGFFNPTVLVYWLFVISFFMNTKTAIDENTMLSYLFTFFIGVFGGKYLVLWLYSVFSEKIKLKLIGITNTINKIIGMLFLLVAVVQFVKYYL